VSAFIKPPKKLPLYLKFGLWIAKRVTGKDLLPPKLLSWYPKSVISSGILELLVSHGEENLDKRLLKMVRVQTSFSVSCPFCIDMNSFEYAKCGITTEEMEALQGRIGLDKIHTFSERERLAMEYAKCISKTPISFPPTLIHELTNSFSEREIVILATTSAQVNYWARLIQALGIPPAGFSDQCTL